MLDHYIKDTDIEIHCDVSYRQQHVLCLPWTAKTTAKNCLKQENNESGAVYTAMQERQAMFFGCMMRREAFESIMTRKITG